MLVPQYTEIGISNFMKEGLTYHGKQWRRINRNLGRPPYHDFSNLDVHKHSRAKLDSQGQRGPNTGQNI